MLQPGRGEASCDEARVQHPSIQPPPASGGCTQPSLESDVIQWGQRRVTPRTTVRTTQSDPLPPPCGYSEDRMYAPHPHPQDGVPAGGSFLASPDHSSRRRAKSKGKLYSIVTNYFILLPLFLVQVQSVHTNIFDVWGIIEMSLLIVVSCNLLLSLDTF